MMSPELKNNKGGATGNAAGKSAKRPSGPIVNRRVFGNMAAAGMGAEDDDDGDSLDSDSDDLLIGGADNDDEVGDSDEDELEVNEMAAEALKNRKSAKIKAAQQAAAGATGNGAAVQPGGDEDF